MSGVGHAIPRDMWPGGVSCSCCTLLAAGVVWWGLGEDLAMLSGRARVGLLLLLEGSFMHESLVVVRCRVILVRFLCGILFFFQSSMFLHSGEF